MDTSLRIELAVLLDSDVVAWKPLAGGDVSTTMRLVLDDGRTVVAKTHHDPPPGVFITEAESLRWLHAAQAVNVPEVVAVQDGGAPDAPGPTALLVMTWVEATGWGVADEEGFGRQLAALHRSGAPTFGRLDRRPTTSRQLPNDPTDTWTVFFAEQRLRPLARRASDADALAPEVIADIDRLVDRLDRYAAGNQPPSRLHGDLWAGNRLVDSAGRSWLIDPAAHGGHREFDLAMMRLFGGFGEAAFAAYAETWPLADGWQERVILHQLAPLITHAIKFGGGYVDATTNAVAKLR
jgi:fructosamine-3-kinase